VLLKFCLPIICFAEVLFTYYLFCCYTGQVNALPVGSTKTPELNANGAFGSPSKDSEYELVRGRGASENTEFNFSNPLYAEPERVIACEIYESVSSLFSTCMCCW